MNRWISTITLVAVIGLISATAPVAVAGELMVAALSALVWALSAVGVGGAVLRRGTLVEAFAFGSGLLGIVIGVIVMFFGISASVLCGVGLLGLVGWLRKGELELPELPLYAVAGTAVWLVIGLIDASSVPVDTDEVYQHLAIPSQLLSEGVLFGGLENPDSSRPLPLHMLWSGPMALGGFTAVKLFNLLFTVALLLQVWKVAVQRKSSPVLAVGVLLGSFTFVREFGLAYNNIPTALWCLLALQACLEDKRWRMAAFSGMALAGKYTAAPVVVGIYLVWLFRSHRRGGLRSSIITVAALTAAALAWLLPWWINNATQGLHPLFPYVGWPMQEFMMLEKYGMGRSAMDMLLLPWNITVHGDPTTFEFLGRVTPVALLLLPSALYFGVKNRSPYLFVSVVGFVGWALGPHWLRYLLPVAPIIAIAAAEGFSKLPKGPMYAIGLAWFVGLPSNLSPWIDGLSERAASVISEDAEQELLSSDISSWPAVEWINNETPLDAKVALLFSWPRAHLERRWTLGSVEDHIPTRTHLELYGDRALTQLRNSGVTYVLRGDIHFIHRTYQFMSESEFHENFVAHERALDALLIRDAVLVFEHGRFSVWRLL